MKAVQVRPALSFAEEVSANESPGRDWFSVDPDVVDEACSVHTTDWAGLMRFHPANQPKI